MKSPEYIPAALLVYLAISGLLRSAATAKAKGEGDKLAFGPTATFHLLGIVAIIGSAGASLYLALIHPPLLLGVAIFGFISLSGTWAFPPQILAGADGLQQIKLWGSTVTMRWADIRRVEYHKGPATTVVADKNGRKIVHAGFNRDSSGFQDLCQQRTGLKIEIHSM